MRSVAVGEDRERVSLPSKAEWLHMALECRNGLNWYPIRCSLPSSNRFGLRGLVGSGMEWLNDPGSACFTEVSDPDRWDDDS